MSARYAPLVLALLIFLCAKTNAFNVYHLGGTDGHPWQTALSYEPGDYRVLNPDGTIRPASAPRGSLCPPDLGGHLGRAHRQCGWAMAAALLSSPIPST